MKTRTRIWWILAALLLLLAGSAWLLESRMADLQTNILLQLGEEITTNQKKWEGATLGKSGAFVWWRELDLGHGISQEAGQISRFALLALVIQLGITLYWKKRT